MSTNANPLPHAFVLPHCLRLWERLEPAFTQICFAGSMRRLCPEVHDLEYVAEPSEGDALTIVLDSLLSSGYLAWDETTKRNGPLWKRFVLPALAMDGSDGLPVDLFLANKENYGYIHMIRTGPADWSHYMVTPLSKGGLRPSHLRCKDGFVWQQAAGGEAVKLPLPSERDLFAAWGLEYVLPQERTEAKVHSLRLALGLPYIVLGKKPDAAPAVPTHHRLEAFA